MLAASKIVCFYALEKFFSAGTDEAEEEIHSCVFVGEVDVLFETEEDDFFYHPEFLVVCPCGETEGHDLRGYTEGRCGRFDVSVYEAGIGL